MVIPISNAIDMEEMATVAFSVHKALGDIPVVLKVMNENGILIKDGRFHFLGLECHALNAVFSDNPVQQIHIDYGAHRCIMFASAIENGLGQRVAAIGIIDTTGMLSLDSLVAHQERINQQLGRKNHGDKHMIRSRR